MRVQDVGGLILDVLFPRRCPYCGKVVGFTNCDDCTKELEEKRLADVRLSPTGDGRVCKKLDTLLVVYEYGGPVREGIHGYKFTGARGSSVPFGELLAGCYKNSGAGEYDLLVAVPQTAKERRRRGYNQSDLLAKEVAKHTGLAYAPDVQRKVRETQRQSTLGREERRRNIKDAFCVAQPQEVKGKRVLIVDDVVTTGSTLGECARIVKKAGAAACGALCMAVALDAVKEGPKRE